VFRESIMAFATVAVRPFVNNASKIGLCFGLLSVLLGAALVWPAHRIGRTNEAVRAWPVAEGRVAAAEVVQRGRNAFVPAVTYAFVVGGRSFSGTTLAFGEDMTRATSAEAARELPAAGATVTVRYDPADPARCALRAGERVAALSVTGVRWGVGLMITGALSFVACLVAAH
jgi:hypothetical protein